MTKLPTAVLNVLDLLHEHGKEAFLVGGCVRDILMNRAIHDYDITSNALPTDVMNLFQEAGYKIIPTGLQHGTITVLSQGMPIEITTYRIEQAYLDHRSPSTVFFTENLIEDLKRRDFTMNAIAYAPDIGIFDPFDGQADIQQKIIRCVGKASDRMEEDALRILRALRFSCCLGFEIEEELQQAIQEHAATLAYISAERIQLELNKMLLSNAPNLLTLLRQYQVLPQIFPCYERMYDHPQATPWHLYDIFTHTDIALNHSINAPLESKLALVFHDIGKLDMETFDEQGIAHYKKHAIVSEKIAIEQLKALHYPHKLIDRVAVLIRYHDYYVTPKRAILRRFMAKLENDLALAMQVLDVQLADDYAKNMERAQEKIDTIMECKALLIQMAKEQDLFSKKDLAVNGHDLVKLGYQGKQIGEALTSLYELVLQEPSLNKKETLLSILQDK